MDILMSIKKKYCDAIFCGRKTIELRKSKPTSFFPRRVLVYESSGCGMIVGEFVCSAVRRWGIDTIWECFGDEICVTRRELEEYYSGRDVGFAWYIQDAMRYDAPVPLSVVGVCRPPQSWCYLRELE